MTECDGFHSVVSPLPRPLAVSGQMTYTLINRLLVEKVLTNALKP